MSTVILKMQNINYYQAFIDAYEAEGWRRSNEEKLKPNQEIKKNKHKIVHSKKTIRRILEEIRGMNRHHIKVEELVHPTVPGEVDVLKLYCSKQVDVQWRILSNVGAKRATTMRKMTF